MDDALSDRIPRHRLGLAAAAALGGAVAMMLLTAFTALPKDIVVGAGVVVMRLVYGPYWLALARIGRPETGRAWFVLESLVYGLAIVGVYRVAEEVFGLTWR